MATRFPEAQKRLFHNVFVCKKCKSKQRSTMHKILEGKMLCKKCGGKAFRPVRKAK
jgi:formylmethanofuran dehydrogenase subunit E